MQNVVVQPVCLDERHTGVNHDPSDARELALRLDRYVAGNTHALPITKHGNVRLRTALIELAWRLVLWQPDCKLVKKWWPVLGNPKASKAARKKAIVAMARQMAVDLWRWRTGRVTPAALGWTMLGA